MDVIKRRPLLERVDELKESIEKLTDIVTQSSGGIIEFSEKSADKLPRGRLQTKNIVSFRKLLESLKKKSKVVDIGSGMGRTIMSASDIIIDKELQVSCLDSWDSEEYTKVWNMKSKDVFLQFCFNIQLIKKFTKVLNYDVLKSINLFEDDSIDMIIIDRQFNKKIFKQSLHEFYKKVKPGGIVFLLLQKSKMVDEFLKEVDANPLMLDAYDNLESPLLPLDIIAFHRK